MPMPRDQHFEHGASPESCAFLEERVFLRSQEAALHCATFRPISDGSHDNALVLIFPPFGEELKCAFRTLVETARAIAAAGVCASLFDYRGTGQSYGDLQTATLGDWLQDAQQVARLAMQRTRSTYLIPLGLRLGANIAREFLLSSRVCRGLIGWEPIVNPDAYIRNMIRFASVRRKLGTLSSVDTQDSGERNVRWVDLEGRAISEELVHGLRPIPPFGGVRGIPSLQLRIVPHESFASDELCDREPVVIRRVSLVAPYIWRRIGVVDARELIDMTVSWVVGLLEPGCPTDP